MMQTIENMIGMMGGVGPGGMNPQCNYFVFMGINQLKRTLSHGIKQAHLQMYYVLSGKYDISFTITFVLWYFIPFTF